MVIIVIINSLFRVKTLSLNTYNYYYYLIYGANKMSKDGVNSLGIAYVALSLEAGNTVEYAFDSIPATDKKIIITILDSQ